MDIPIQRVEEFLHQRIPLAKAMNCQVKESTREEIVLSAPRFANTVEGETLFGGSMMAVAAFASWTLLQISLRRLDYLPDAQLSRSKWSMAAAPAAGSIEFMARCLPPDKEWQQFLRMLSRKGEATVALEVRLENDLQLATLSCEYETRDLDQSQP